MHPQFLASRTRAIQLVNKGQMPLKIRGAKKDQLQQEFDNVRKQTLEVIKRSATDAETEWKVMTVERYKETHEGKGPVADGAHRNPADVPR